MSLKYEPASDPLHILKPGIAAESMGRLASLKGLALVSPTLEIHGGAAVSYERGTPVRRGDGEAGEPEESGARQQPPHRPPLVHLLALGARTVDDGQQRSPVRPSP